MRNVHCKMLAEALIAIAHLVWTASCWCFGHFLFLVIFGCSADGGYNKAGFSVCQGSDPIGLFCLLVGSMLFFRIARHVLDFFYRGELPGNGEEVLRKLSKLVNAQTTSEGRKQKRK